MTYGSNKQKNSFIPKNQFFNMEISPFIVRYNSPLSLMLSLFYYKKL